MQPAHLTPPTLAPACALADLGRCAAPCLGAITTELYAEIVARAAAAIAADPGEIVDLLDARMASLARQERYEDAATVRDRLGALLRGAIRAQRLAPLAAIPELVAARRSPVGGWELVCVRYGRLAGSSRSPRGADPMPYVEALPPAPRSSPRRPAPAPAALPEETEKILHWLDEPGVRLVRVDGAWTCPVDGAQRLTVPDARSRGGR